MEPENNDASQNPQELLESLRPKKRRWIFRGIVLLVIVIGVGLYIRNRNKTPEQTIWKTHTVGRGDIVLTATATGNLEPKQKVTIGSELSGLLLEINVEENDRVKKGQVLARLDTESLDIELAQAKASAQSARASMQRAKASLTEANTNLARVQKLVSKSALATRHLDEAKARVSRAKADIASARADNARARAGVRAVNARIQKSIITSPIDGVVLSRSVEPGNTVASALQAPELFVIAKDLVKMELHVLISEADVGLVQPGQDADFQVSAWPNRIFKAKVDTISLSPTITNNVVTYRTVLEVENKDGALRPGMTAATTIQTGTRSDVLRIPSAALWFEPKVEKSSFRLGPRRKSKDFKKGSAIYILKDNKPVKTALVLGRSDDQHVEVISGELKKGDQIVIGQEEPKPPEDGKKKSPEKKEKAPS